MSGITKNERRLAVAAAKNAEGKKRVEYVIAAYDDTGFALDDLYGAIEEARNDLAADGNGEKFVARVNIALMAARDTVLENRRAAQE